MPTVKSLMSAPAAGTPTTNLALLGASRDTASYAFVNDITSIEGALEWLNEEADKATTDLDKTIEHGCRIGVVGALIDAHEEWTVPVGPDETTKIDDLREITIRRKKVDQRTLVKDGQIQFSRLTQPQRARILHYSPSHIRL